RICSGDKRTLIMCSLAPIIGIAK
ncbi:hypothetical protein VCHENC02_2783B, partial [Vibrio harveyi]